MSNSISGAIAVILALGFLLFYAIRLADVVLWIIIVGNAAFLVYDYIDSIRKGEDLI